MMNNSKEFEAFDKTMHDLMNVSHDELKVELDREKARKIKRKAKKKPSASDRDDGGKSD